jgi:hypothetical protein
MTPNQRKSAMISNPFLSIPQVDTPQSRSWAMGFAFGFQGPEQSTLTPTDIQPEDADAFDQGVLTGQGAAIDGVPLNRDCVDLNAEGPSAIHFAGDAAVESAFFVGGVITHAEKLASLVAGGLAEGVIAVVMLSIALETFTDDPESSLVNEAEALQSALQRVGIDNASELFMGGAVDLTAIGCELKLTPIFRSLDAATAATVASGRDHWLVVNWRSNASGGINVVAASQQ